ncbi:DUF2269 domain-containing protein [Rhizobium sp. S-51]|uniref:DUF2269 domain-containing protein n=1 Tax=Rhizobium terricola TaxID=2728849 RepID=A0A7Y0ATI4_9HYPH|nr:DUF2269 domain-containing protein [Rhizobium terricola]NML73226.1 DUF2269 domain-containing protein [Rhizobium terricola]
MLDDLLRLAHVIGAAVLFGTGAGIAFFMVLADRTRDPRLIAHVAGTVVIADTLFTATAAVLQPLTGAWLAHRIGWPLTTGWIALSLVLYGVVGLFWLPVVWIQIQLRNLARNAADANLPLPPRYHRLYSIWFAFGFPAFLSMIGILYLMLIRPDPVF